MWNENNILIVMIKIKQLFTLCDSHFEYYIYILGLK